MEQFYFESPPNENYFHPTYFMSKKTTNAKKKYSSDELEALAIIEGLKRFHEYLLGIPFKIVTDCSAFQKPMEKRDSDDSHYALGIIFTRV